MDAEISGMVNELVFFFRQKRKILIF
jgi:hypothetical protein